MIENKQTNKLCLRWTGNQKRIGITGGIASGKTLIGDFLSQHKQWPILDADLYAHEALDHGNKIYKKVLLRYGDKVTRKSKNNQVKINRKELAQIIFQNNNEKKWLESLIHPFVNKRIYEELEKYKSNSVILLIIPLLFEKNYTSICTEILYIDCSREKQIERLYLRDKLSYYEANQRINSQWEPYLKKELSDLIINNSNDDESWKEQLKNLYGF